MKTQDYILDHMDVECPVLAIPNWLFEQNPYTSLSDDARLVYALLLADKYGKSVLNGYVVVGEKLNFRTSPLETVRYMLACSKRTAVKVLAELTNAELIAA